MSGQVAFDVDGNLVGGDDIAAQVRQVFTNLAAALESVGANFSHVIKLNYYCVDAIEPASAAGAYTLLDFEPSFAQRATEGPAVAR